MDSVPDFIPTKRLRPSGIQPFLLSGAPPSYPPDFARISLGCRPDFGRISSRPSMVFHLYFILSLGFEPVFRKHDGFEPVFHSVVGISTCILKTKDGFQPVFHSVVGISTCISKTKTIDFNLYFIPSWRRRKIRLGPPKPCARIPRMT